MVDEQDIRDDVWGLLLEGFLTDVLPGLPLSGPDRAVPAVGQGGEEKRIAPGIAPTACSRGAIRGSWQPGGEPARRGWSR